MLIDELGSGDLIAVLDQTLLVLYHDDRAETRTPWGPGQDALYEMFVALDTNDVVWELGVTWSGRNDGRLVCFMAARENGMRTKSSMLPITILRRLSDVEG